jgi:hypothetical protein
MTAPRRNRQAKGANQTRKSVVNYRTADSIQRSLASAARQMTTKESDYVHCRMNPFEGSGRTAIPDGGNNGFIVSDVTMYDTFTVPAGITTTIQTLPTMPCSAMITPSSGTINVNGTVFTPYAAGAATGQANNWAPLSIMPVWQAPNAVTTGVTQLTPSQTPVDPYSATTSRLVAQGFRLVYTGEAQLCSGFITVTPNDIAIQEFQTTSGANPPPYGTCNLVVVDPNQATYYVAPQGTTVLNMDFSVNPTAMTRDSVSFRPEEGVLFIPKHKAKDFKNKPVVDCAYGIAMNADYATIGTMNVISNALMANGTTTTPSSFGGGIVWYDNDWSGAQITISGCQTNTPFRWETVWCFESNPSNGSVMSNLTRKTEPDQPKQIERAANIQTAQPVAIPANGKYLPRIR